MGWRLPRGRVGSRRRWCWMSERERKPPGREPIKVPPMERVSEVVAEVRAGARPDMHVPVGVFADDAVMSQLLRDHSLEQLLNVSALPGVTRQALGMPDMHEGYGFPVGCVMGTVLP